MKSQISVCVLLVLACHVALSLGNPNLISCTPEDVPEKWRNGCFWIHCAKDDNGKVATHLRGCVVRSCGGKPGTWIKGDDSKTFPECCDGLECNN